MNSLIILQIVFIASVQLTTVSLTPVNETTLFLQLTNFSHEVVHNFKPNENDNISIVKPVEVVKEKKPKFIKLKTSPYTIISNSSGCSDSSDDFPEFFTEKQRKHGGIILVILVGIYCFTILAVICDKYFLPCVETICIKLHLSKDVAAATFMSVATSTPELFTNVIGTFITESDIGIGTIVGSSLFNTLGVASLGGLAASKPIQLEWWPLTRDCMIYIVAVCLLVAITWDGLIFWYEGLILFIAYFLYFTVMFNNDRITSFFKRHLPKNNKVHAINDVKDMKTVSEKKEPPKDDRSIMGSAYGTYKEEPFTIETPVIGLPETISQAETVKEDALFEIPTGSWFKKFFFFYTWPIKVLLYYTVPDPEVHPNLFPVTFLLCICYIGGNSYLVSWMLTILGSMFHIPDAVLGLTFLAAGGALPESISITIMSRRGEGGMGVSNSLGANTMDILMSLGLPWFLKTIIMGTNPSSYIQIESGSIEYTILGLIGAAAALYITLFFNKFQLRRRVGVILAVIYLCCVSGAIVSELLVRNHCNS